MDVLLGQKEVAGKIHATQAVRLVDMTDEALVEMIQNGSDAAFTELTRRYMYKSYGIAYQMVGDMETAKDLSQDVFVKVYTSIHKFDKKSKFFSWFYRILVNLCINYTRRKKTVSFIPFSEIFFRSGETPDNRLIDKESVEEISERQRIVRDAVNRLSSKHKKVVILCDLEGFPQEEAAEILGIAIGTVRSRLHYARHNLKRFLKDYLKEI